MEAAFRNLVELTARGDCDADPPEVRALSSADIALRAWERA